MIRVGVGASAREGTSVLEVVPEERETDKHAVAAVGGSLLEELARGGAHQLLAAAWQAEVAADIDAHAHLVDEAGHRLVVRNGFPAPREVATAAGAVPVRVRGSTTSGSRRRSGSGSGSPRRSCPGGAEVPP
ncbi:MAG: hypothetical protein CSA58_07960, partial [Micrococcales bacterium]